MFPLYNSPLVQISVQGMCAPILLILARQTKTTNKWKTYYILYYSSNNYGLLGKYGTSLQQIMI